MIIIHRLGQNSTHDVIRTRLISILMGAKMQRLEVVRGRTEFLSDFSIPQANPTQPVTAGFGAPSFRLWKWSRSG